MYYYHKYVQVVKTANLYKTKNKHYCNYDL